MKTWEQIVSEDRYLKSDIANEFRNLKTPFISNDPFACWCENACEVLRNNPILSKRLIDLAADALATFNALPKYLPEYVPSKAMAKLIKKFKRTAGNIYTCCNTKTHNVAYGRIRMQIQDFCPHPTDKLTLDEFDSIDGKVIEIVMCSICRKHFGGTQ